ncbi:hypothetical protein UPYG_G00271480 [Umbra pygmaea]|uniref:Periphilin-1 C-terminal domain-containing protein n=1 Tax=Umbra pygmaea TaxID=75934 RepID=A0ABD0WT63_UMBPY
MLKDHALPDFTSSCLTHIFSRPSKTSMSGQKKSDIREAYEHHILDKEVAFERIVNVIERRTAMATPEQDYDRELEYEASRYGSIQSYHFDGQRGYHSESVQSGNNRGYHGNSTPMGNIGGRSSPTRRKEDCRDQYYRPFRDDSSEGRQEELRAPEGFMRRRPGPHSLIPAKDAYSAVRDRSPIRSTPLGPAPRRGTPPGPAPRRGTLPGPAPRRCTPPGPAPRRCTPPGPAPRRCTPPGPAPRRCTPPGPAPRRCTPPGPALRRGTPPGPALRRGTPPGPALRRGTPPGPAHRRGTPPGAAHRRGTPPGAAHRRGTPPGPAPRRGTPPGPASRRGTPPGPASRRGTPPGPASRRSTSPGPASRRSTSPGPAPRRGTPPGPAPRRGTPPGPALIQSGLNSLRRSYSPDREQGSFSYQQRQQRRYTKEPFSQIRELDKSRLLGHVKSVSPDGPPHCSVPIKEECAPSLLAEPDGMATVKKEKEQMQDFKTRRSQAIAARALEIEKLYKQDCETFGTVVKMLVEKEPSLEKLLQNPLKDNLIEIRERCLDDLRHFITELDQVIHKA